MHSAASPPQTMLPQTVENHVTVRGSCRYVIFGFVFVLCAVVPASSLAGQPPAIERLYPPGAKVGSKIDVKVSGKPGDGELNVWSELNELEFQFSDKKDTATVTVPESATPGIHWIRFFNADGATSFLPFVVGILDEVIEKEPNNRLNEIQSIDSSRVVVNGVLEKSGDVDCYSIPIRTDETLVISVLAHRQLNSPMDAVIQLLNSRGTVLLQNDDDHGLDPQLVYTALSDDTLTVRIFAFPSAPNSTIQFAGGANYVYRLTLTTGPFVDYCLPTAVSTSMPQVVNVVGWNLTGSDPEFNLKTQSIDATVDTRIQGPFAESTNVDAVLIPSLIEADSGGELDPPFCVSGVIAEVNQVDTYRFTGSKSQKLRFRTVSRAVYSPLDPLLILRDSGGKEIKQADDVSKDDLDADLTVTLPADGLYSVALQDRFGHGGTRYFYRLHVEPADADFEVTVGNDRFAMSSEKPLEIDVSVKRMENYSEAITIQLEGLPEGLSCESMTSSSEGESSKSVKLSVSGAAKEAFNGHIRIVATSESGRRREAAATSIPATANRNLIWLTAPAVSAPAAEATDDADAMNE
ncbi:MAG: PPC domain-containing protein [Planctomycetaceae bacterium]